MKQQANKDAREQTHVTGNERSHVPANQDDGFEGEVTVDLMKTGKQTNHEDSVWCPNRFKSFIFY